MPTHRFTNRSRLLLACTCLAGLSMPVIVEARNDGVKATPMQNGGAAQDPLQPRFPECRAFVEVLRAIRDQDLDTFKQAFSTQISQTIETEEDWRQGLVYYTDLVASFCTDPSDFVDITYLFRPSPDAQDRGTLTIIYLGREQFTIDMRREGFRWLIDDK